ncbi:hypothetical protein [Anaerosacchariphilus polymeriproducens]|uniref:Uncharacterized protein n=1 Tax=Anaerosacchariphilus polymeriproducens TaxID=1812858 RepID=A0A371AZ72_9FIRM|nr:hypothetical protein [Anaerosacchariphilus polymeriproducens]RDU24802.1 hypothetical protein DWV06_02160 [Anaerosacchariphilus polymeriproducens]
MKKKLCSIIGLTVITFFITAFMSKPVYAYSIETLNDSSDFHEIKKMEDEIMKNARGFFADEAENIDFTVDYSHAVKIYVDTNIFENNTITQDIVSNTIKQAVYIWEIPVKVAEDEYVICTVSRKPPIENEVKQELLNNGTYTEEEIQEAEAKVGQWMIAASSYDKTKKDYISEIEKVLGESFNKEDKKHLYLLGGTPNMRMPFGLLESNQKYSIMTLDLIKPDTDSSSNARNLKEDLQTNTIYNFIKVKKWVSNLPPENAGDSGYAKQITKKYFAIQDTKSSKIPIIMGLVLMIIVVIIIFLYLKQKLIHSKR